MNEDAQCPHCGASMIEYKHGFNLGLAAFLGKLFDAGGPAKTDDLGLTYSQRTNSQKLRYWGLAVQVTPNESAARKRGWWQITEKGVAFVLGLVRIPKYAIVYRNNVMRLEGECLLFSEVSEGYQYQADYADQARTQLFDEDGQGAFDFNNN